MTNDPPPQESPEPEEPLEQILSEFLNLMDEANSLLLPDEEVEQRLRRLTGDEFPAAGDPGRSAPSAEPDDRRPEPEPGSYDDPADRPTPPEGEIDCADTGCIEAAAWPGAAEVGAAREDAARIRAEALKQAAEIEGEARRRAAEIEERARYRAEEYKDAGVIKAAERLAEARREAEGILADARSELEEARKRATRITELAQAHASGRLAGAEQNAWLVQCGTLSQLTFPELTFPAESGTEDLIPRSAAPSRELMVYAPPVPHAPATAPPTVEPLEDDDMPSEGELVDDDPGVGPPGSGPRDREADDPLIFTGADVAGACAHRPRQPGGFRLPVRPWPSSGQVHCPMVAVSAMNAGTDDDRLRSDTLLMHLRRSLYQILQDAFDTAGIGWMRCRAYDRGDSVLVLLPPDVMPELLANTLIDGTRIGLRRHNRLSSDQAQLRIRAALHMGVVNFDAAGATGTALDLLYRLLDAPEFSAAFRDVPGDLALVTSDYVYENVIRHYSELLECDELRPLPVFGDDQFQAWCYFPARLRGGHSVPALGEAPVGADRARRLVAGRHDVLIRTRGSVVTVRSEPAPAIRRRTRTSRPALWADSAVDGRDEELAQLAAWLDEGVPILVCGPPGVGKSTLLYEFAGQRAAAGADVVSVSAAGMAVDDLVQTLFRRCYDAEGHRPGATRLRRMMAMIGSLVLVDDFTGSANDAEELLDMIPGGEVIITSRERIEWNRGRLLELRGLAERTALKLLEKELGPTRARGRNREAAGRLCRATDGNPRALLQAAFAARTTGSALAADPDEVTRALYGGTDPEARAVIKVLRTLDGAPVPPGLLARLADVPNGRRVLADLRRARLAQATGSGYVLTVVSDAPLPAGGTPAQPADYVRPLARWARVVQPNQVAEAASVIVVVLTDALRQGVHGPARELARAAAPALGMSLRWEAWRQVLSLGGSAARESGAADDETYFEGEEEVRSRALGITAEPPPVAAPRALAAARGQDGSVWHTALTLICVVFVVLGGAGIFFATRDPGDGVVSPRMSPNAATLATPETAPPGAVPPRSVPRDALPPGSVSRQPVTVGSGPIRVEMRPSLRMASTLVAGTTAAVTLTGFSPREKVRFSLSGKATVTLVNITIEPDGRATAMIRQQAPPGTYTVLATGLSSGRTAEAELRLV